ncbi:hypothetical protein BGZ99_004393 [Dissophora globulifera]|uniref:Uncharacterized protein n=1 Tax=Dissophora globulifera TaxID=979702 RepID=A0A9P6RMM4_9FUNG|nr:hypothetical protein BGZ99_004393 [Dissophora globulifera]
MMLPVSKTLGREANGTRSGLERPKGRTSFLRTPGTPDLEDSLINTKRRKDNKVWWRRERASKMACDPRITQPIPLAPRVLSNGTHEFDPTVIVLSFDGLRADYLKRGLTPNILSIGANGVAAEYMQPSFPTLTFPNHYSMSTGLYPSSHGIVANMFYDPVLNEDFNYKIPEKSWDPKWWGGEPIWETAVHQKQRSGVIMWPGGESLRPVRPTYHVRYRTGVSVLEKMETLLAWLDKPREERPTVMTVYISEVDSTGHDFGPYGKKTQKALGEVDSAVGVLLDGLRARGGLDKVVNLVLVSDHGMSYVSTAKCIYYDDYIDTSDLILEESLQPHLSIRTKDPQRMLEIYHTLKEVQERDHLPFKVYRRDEIPERYNYRDNERIAPVVVLADPGFVMTRRDMGLAVAGAHGWDNEMEDMRAIFMASGPSFPNFGPEKLRPFENVELYEIIARTVGLQVKEGATDGVHNGYVAQPC